jgi:hypothetical protein
MEAGEIGFAHLMVMARTSQALKRSRTASPFDEKAVLATARESTVGRLYYDCQHLRHAQDPQGYAAAEAEAVEARTLEIKSGGNGWSVSRSFDSAGGGARRWSAGRKAGKDDKRERDRRLADALVSCTGASGAAAGHGLDRDADGLGGAPAGGWSSRRPSQPDRGVACDCSLVRVWAPTPP